MQGVSAYLFDYEEDRYPVDYPVAAIYFKDEMKNGARPELDSIRYAPMSEYDVNAFDTWGQEAINKTMTGMNFVSGSNSNIDEWEDPSRALLETEEVVFITLPHITVSVKRYYQYKDGKWSSVVGYIQ